MTDAGQKGGMTSESLVETTRVVLQCPIAHSLQEGVIMEIVQYLLGAKRDKHALWGHFHSKPWPPVFFTDYPESDGKAPAAGQAWSYSTLIAGHSNTQDPCSRACGLIFKSSMATLVLPRW